MAGKRKLNYPIFGSMAPYNPARAALSPIDIQGLLDARRENDAYLAQPFGTIAPYDPSLRERIAWGVAEGAGALGAGKYRQQWIADKTAEVVDLVPFLGGAVGFDEAKRDYDAGNYGKAALNVGLAGLAGLLPVAGGVLKKVGRRGLRKVDELAANRLKSVEGDRFPIRPFPVRPTPPIEDYYPRGVPADAAGNLKFDPEGTELTAPWIVGRRTVNGPDERFPAERVDELVEAVTGVRPERVPRAEIDENDGVLRTGYTEDEQYLGPYEVRVAADLPPDEQAEVLFHEGGGHGMDLKIAPPATRDEFRSMKWGIQSDDDAVKRELYEIYRQGNNPKAEFWGPSGYDLRLRG